MISITSRVHHHLNKTHAAFYQSHPRGLDRAMPRKRMEYWLEPSVERAAEFVSRIAQNQSFLLYVPVAIAVEAANFLLNMPLAMSSKPLANPLI